MHSDRILNSSRVRAIAHSNANMPGGDSGNCELHLASKHVDHLVAESFSGVG
jgi:hypothetical protein